MESKPGPYSTTIIIQAMLKDPTDGEAARRFTAKYQPRIRERLARRGLQDHDADDLTGVVLAELFTGNSLRRFLFAGKEKFNHWLDRKVKHRVLDFYRARSRRPDAWSVGNPDAQEALERAAEACVADVADAWAEDVERAGLAMRTVEAVVDPVHMRAFKARVLDGRRAADVAAELGMTDVAVWTAQSRVSKQLREEFARLEFADAAAAGTTARRAANAGSGCADGGAR